MTDNNVFVPNDTFGDRKKTAIALTGAADEYGISQRAVKTTSRGFDITEELAALVFEDGDGESEEDRLEREEAERLAAEQAEADRLAAEQAEADRLAAEQAEKDEATKNKESTKGSKSASGNRAAKTSGTNKE